MLDLVFAARPDAAYEINGTVYGDLSEGVDITPGTGWVQWRGQSGHDYSSSLSVKDQEVRIPVVLNEGFVFREAGHYEVKVTTYRVEGSGAPVVTNAVGIDLSPMPEDVERSRVKAIEAEIGVAGDNVTVEGAKEDAWDRLAALGGDDALRLKVKLILGESDRMRNVANEALASTRNLALQLKLLEDAWRNPAQMPVYDLLGELQETRMWMRGEMEPSWVMVVAPKEDEATLRRRREAAADVDELVRSIPLRSGENRDSALYLLFETMPLTKAQTEMLRPALVDAFAHMDDLAQAMLLETKWPLLKDPRMVPILKAMLDEPAGKKNISDELKRLVELDPEAAKPHVVRAICDAKISVSLATVTEMPQETLPEVDACLGQMLGAGPKDKNDLQWQWRAEVAGRFATAAILPAIKAGMKYPDQDKFLLPVLLRYAPKEAMERIEKLDAGSKQGEFNRQQDFYEMDRIYRARGVPYPPELLKFLREMEEHDAGSEAGFAVYQLAQDGTAEDEALFRKRLARLREERAAAGKTVTLAPINAELDPPEGLEVELMSALRNSSRWFVSNAEAAELANGCMSEECRRVGEPRHPDAPNTAEARVLFRQRRLEVVG